MSVHILLLWSLVFVTPQGKEHYEWKQVQTFTQSQTEGSLAQCLRYAHQVQKDTSKFKCVPMIRRL